MAAPLFGIAAWSGTGKTTFLTGLVAELKRRGLRVGVIKHDAHGFELDREGKDTWRFKQAGADVVAIASKTMAAVMEQRSLTAAELAKRVRDVDVILAEGYKHGDMPKIGLYRAASGRPLTGEPESFCCLVTDTPFDTAVPQFALDDYSGVADFILALR